MWNGICKTDVGSIRRQRLAMDGGWRMVAMVGVVARMIISADKSITGGQIMVALIVEMMTLAVDNVARS
jgi:hypothetical protein